MRPVRPPSRRARGASPRSFVGSSLRSDLRRRQMRARPFGGEILRRLFLELRGAPASQLRERARPPAARQCVCGPAACCRGGGAGAARRGEGAATLAANIWGARVPSCGSPRARPPRAAVCGQPACGRRCGGAAAQASAGLFWKRAPRPKLPRRCRRRARRAVRCGPGRPRGSDFSAVNVLCASVLPQELKHTMRRLSNFGASRYVAATST